MTTIAVAGVESPVPSPGPPAAAENGSGFWQRHRLAIYVAKRLAAALGTVLAATILIYVALIVLPGDVVTSVLGKSGSPAEVARLRAELGGDQNPALGYLQFLGGLLHGDLGVSTVGLVVGQRVSIGGLIAAPLAHSLILAGITLVLFLPLMVALGLTAGLRPGSRLDGFLSAGSLTLGSLPEYFVAAVLIAIFFDKLSWFPPVSSIGDGESLFAHPKALVLPIATLLIVSLAFGSRQLRGSVANILDSDYVTFAQLNGYSRRTIVRKYILPNAIGPTIQIVAQQLQYLISGLVIVETVYNYPGIGNVLMRSLNAQDISETLAIAVILATLAVLVNLLADILAILVDPVQRTSL